MMSLDYFAVFLLLCTVDSQMTTTTDCGLEFSCFRYPDGCVDTSCVFIYKWKSNGADKTDFVIAADIGEIRNGWLGIGFSLDDQMGQDDVVACKSLGEVQHYRTTGHEEPILMNRFEPTIGLSNMRVASERGWLICSFTRQDRMGEEENYFDLNNSNEYHILAAFGMLDFNENLIEHLKKVASSNRFTFKKTAEILLPTETTTSTIIRITEVTTIDATTDVSLSTTSTVIRQTTATTESENTFMTTTTTTTTEYQNIFIATATTVGRNPLIAAPLIPVLQNDDIDISDCGTKFGCFLYPTNCRGADCTFIYRYSSNDSSEVSFDLQAKVNTVPSWLAIGFSNDRSMGDDGVVVCFDQGTIEQRYNARRERPDLLDDTKPSIGLSRSHVSFDNGWLKCSFNRLKNVDNVNGYFDLDRKYYLLAAFGQSPGGIMRQHIENVASNSLTNFSAFTIASGESSATNSNKIKAHACIMIFAWLFFASTGILFARYYKKSFSSVKLFDLDFWFIAHRSLMLAVPILAITAFLVILSALNWKWVELEFTTEYAHSIFGIVAIVLAIINPIIGVFRCDKEHEYRFVFNGIHRTAGLTAFLFAIIALYLGTLSDKIDLDTKGWGILLGWTLWALVIITSNELLTYLSRSKASMSERFSSNGDIIISSFHSNLPEYQSYTPSPRDKLNTIREILLAAHLLITFSFVIAIVVVVGREGV